jgi:hypothetical protein
MNSTEHPWRMSESSEVRAFPAALADEVRAVLPQLSDYQLRPPAAAFQVRVRGETIDIPSRVYYRESQVLSCASRPGVQGLIALCLGTRHHDGYLREKCVKRLIEIEEPWIVPFIIQLIGEYVVTIVKLIEQALPNLNTALYTEFIAANRAYFETIGRRTISYWDVYYRNEYPNSKDYPGRRIHATLHLTCCTG